jgi:glycosyltransferase involved in cell wall biosynthesis
MKVAMVNDCAFVGETLLKYLPANIEREHIKRGRGLWSKTFGITYKVLRAKADVYHVYYLLQDCYIASKSGKRPLVGHAMGSDLRESLKTRKWGWIVKSNLKNCSRILVCQPTTLDLARQFNESAQYFPIPFDPAVFFPKPMPEKHDRRRVFIASAHDFAVKGTDKFLHALASVSTPVTVKAIRFGRDYARARQLAEKLGIKMDFLDRVEHHKINELYWESDLVLGSFGVGQLDTVAIEAMACGRPVVHSVYERLFPRCPLEELRTVEDATKLISKLLANNEERERRIKKQLEYVNATHSAPLLAGKLMRIYSELVERSDFGN